VYVLYTRTEQQKRKTTDIETKWWSIYKEKKQAVKKTKFHNAAGVIIYYAKCGWDEKLRIP